MTESCFTDSKHRPTPEEIRSALDSCFPLWERLTTFIEKSYRIEGNWSTWGPAKSGCAGGPAVARRALAVHSSDQRIRCKRCGEAAAGKDATAPEHIMRAMAIPTELMQLEQNGGTLR